jgi:hypothetical protein
MYNPDKMYEVPSIALTYADKQEVLNQSLVKRYNVDLTNYPLKTPSPMKRCFQSPYSNHRLPKKTSPLADNVKFSLSSAENFEVQKDKLVDLNKPRHAIKSLHGIQSIETYGGRAAAKNIPEESVKTWDSTSTSKAQPSCQSYEAAGYELPGHEPQSRFSEPEKVQVAPVHTKQQQDRTQTILTLMGTIKLLESKNSELIKSRKGVDSELQNERMHNAELQAQVADLQQQLRLKARHEANVAKGDAYAVTQDENLNAFAKNRPVC